MGGPRDSRLKNWPGSYRRKRIRWLSLLNSHLCLTSLRPAPSLRQAPLCSSSRAARRARRASPAGPRRHRAHTRSTTPWSSQMMRSELRYLLSSTSHPPPALIMAGSQGSRSALAYFMPATSTLDSASASSSAHSLGERTLSSTAAKRPALAGRAVAAQSMGLMVTGLASGGGWSSERKPGGRDTSRDA